MAWGGGGRGVSGEGEREKWYLILDRHLRTELVPGCSNLDSVSITQLFGFATLLCFHWKSLISLKLLAQIHGNLSNFNQANKL